MSFELKTYLKVQNARHGSSKFIFILLIASKMCDKNVFRRIMQMSFIVNTNKLQTIKVKEEVSCIFQ